MKLNWNKLKLRETLSNIIDNRGKTPPVEKNGYELLEVNAISATDKFPKYEDVRKYVSKETYFTWFRSGHPVIGDILIPTVGTLGAVSYVNKDNCCIAQNLIAIRGNPKVIDSNFLYYTLRNPIVRKRLLNLDIGGVQPSIKVPHLLDLEISIPPIEVQKQISTILSNLDSKIELNSKINNNLEQQAQALFKSWFVDFEPFGGKMPEDWKVGKLGDFVEIKRGGSPRPIQDYLVQEGLNWLKISDATAEISPFILDIKEHIKQEGLNKTVLLNKGALVLSNSATPGIPKFLNVDTCIHDGWLYFPKSKFSNEYLFLLFNHIRNGLISLGNGSVFTNLKTDILRNFVVTLASEKILLQFDNIISSIFTSIKINREEIATLTSLRDTLLPKLMSGEIDVSKVKIDDLTSTDKLSFSKK